MLVLTNAQMRAADRYTIEEKGVSSLTLMESAGRALAIEAEKLAEDGKILCVCGGGNNGGDGFVCVRHMTRAGRMPTPEVLCMAEKFSEDCERNRQAWKEMGGVCMTELPQKRYARIIDCLFGTGFHGKLTGKEKCSSNG